MKHKILFLLLFVSNTKLCFSQSFINGDLNGTVNGLSSLPTNWLNVPLGDHNCVANNSGGTTPDLTCLTGPGDTINGIIGNPYSGNTFISGAFGSMQNFFSQEGIMQTVNGFIIGKQYSIHFRQSVVKQINSIDNTGSWSIYIDTVLAGITIPTHSSELFNSTSFAWDARRVSFTATSSSHLIKFLPMDDDSNWVTSTTDTTGALRMGIDSIGLGIITGIDELNSNSSFKMFPNPSNGSFVITINGILNKQTHLTITNAFGQIVDEIALVNTTTNYENTSISNGLYFYTIRSKDEEMQRGKFLIVK